MKSRDIRSGRFGVVERMRKTVAAAPWPSCGATAPVALQAGCLISSSEDASGNNLLDGTLGGAKGVTAVGGGGFARGLVAAAGWCFVVSGARGERPTGATAVWRPMEYMVSIGEGLLRATNPLGGCVCGGPGAWNGGRLLSDWRTVLIGLADGCYRLALVVGAGRPIRLAAGTRTRCLVGVVLAGRPRRTGRTRARSGLRPWLCWPGCAR